MSYDKSLAAAVAAQFEAKKQKRQSLLSGRRSLLYSEIPELKDIENEIALISFSVFRRVTGGYDPSAAAKEIHDRSLELCQKRDSLLKKAGYDKSFLNPPYDCPLCKDEGFLDDSYCSCFKKKLTEAVFAESNLASFSSNSFDKFELSWYPESMEGTDENPREIMKCIFDECKKFAEGFNENTTDNLLLTGPSGVGKTFLSSCIANTLISQDVSVIYQTAGVVFSLMEKIKFSKAPEPADQYTANRITECDLLILDDLGAEFITEFSVTELFRIINTRLLSGKKTIINTNLSLGDIKHIYSERTLSRLIGSYNILKFYGDDIRMLKKLKS